METHISWVFLTGAHAYKVKKAVRLAFLDFSSLALRHAACEEELRLNRRLAPDYYLDVVPITGTPDAPALGGPGPALEYAVRMRAFPEDGLLTDALAQGRLAPGIVDRLAIEVAAFHARAERATNVAHGSPDAVLAAALANFATLRPLVAPAERNALDQLEQWTRAEHDARRADFVARQRTGAIRECHGDLHLGNVALDGERLVIFDCIEFDPALRFIDPMAEIAFTVMDLAAHARDDLAWRFLSAYLDATGDHAGLPVLRFYLVYRALVRAKVTALRVATAQTEAVRAPLAANVMRYVRLAAQYAEPPRPGLVLMHGLSGSGKTTLSQALLERIGAVRVRSDVERKRLAGLAPDAHSGSPVDAGLYARDVSDALYGHLLDTARTIVDSGFNAIVDAAFLARRHRALFLAQACMLRRHLLFVDCAAAPATLRARVAARVRAGSDASEATLAVLDRQLATAEGFTSDELPMVERFDADAPADAHRLDRFAAEVARRLQAA